MNKKLILTILMILVMVGSVVGVGSTGSVDYANADAWKTAYPGVVLGGDVTYPVHITTADGAGTLEFYGL